MTTKQLHKKWRKQFNLDCLKRDDNKCVFCDIKDELDVHHITDRSEMPNHGYSILNGITLCKKHHLLCEEFHMKGHCDSKYHPDKLYEIIGSSYENAFYDSEKLN